MSYQIIHNFLGQADIDAVKALTKDNKFVTSTCYDRNLQKNLEDKTKRNSQSTKVNNIDVNKIFNDNLEKHGYIFIPREFDIVKYEAGGFFVAHTDYSNGPGDCTFVFCLQASEEGGETMLFAEPQEEEDSTVTVHQEYEEDDDGAVIGEDIFGVKQEVGDLLIFDKEIKHSGQLVLKGTKIIIKGNAVKIEKKEFIAVNVEADNKYFIFEINQLKRQSNNHYCSIFLEKKKENPKLIGYRYDENNLSAKSAENILYGRYDRRYGLCDGGPESDVEDVGPEDSDEPDSNKSDSDNGFSMFN